MQKFHAKRYRYTCPLSIELKHKYMAFVNYAIPFFGLSKRPAQPGLTVPSLQPRSLQTGDPLFYGLCMNAMVRYLLAAYL